MSILLRLSTYLLMIILFFNRKDNFSKLMNYREDLEIKLQKVTLAMQEVVEDISKTDQEKQRIICKLIEFKKAITSCLTFPSIFKILLTSIFDFDLTFL